jgi:DNA (cytosine-5)-methyltransferase 1
VAWRVLDSRHFGVPQRRRRVFIVACDVGGRTGAERAGEVLAVGQGCPGHPTSGGDEVPAATDGVGGGVVGPLFTTGDNQRTPVNRQSVAAGHIVTGFHLTHDPIHLEGASLPLGHKSTGNGVQTAAGVRRLTPRECERLQGFPDDWTLIPWCGKPAPDSRRYAALGDAVTVPVARWLGERLLAHTMMEAAA